jgi:hypothetical protein
MLTAIALVFALVLFLIAAFRVTEPERGRLVCFGLACIALAELLRGVGPALIH